MKTYDLDAFDAVPSSKELFTNNLTLDQLPTIEEVKTLANWTSEMLDRFGRDASFFEIDAAGDKQDRSAAMQAFAYLGAENSWSDEQILSALYDIDDRWGKYKDRKDREKRLVDFVNRARTKIGYDPVIDINLSKFLDAKPTDLVEPDSKLIFGAQEFVDMDFPINWMLEGLLPAAGFGFVTGYPGTGKTTFCLQLGYHLALGYDKFLKWDNIAGAKKVLFLSLEMAKAPLNLFMGKSIEGYSDRRLLNKNFLVAPLGVSLPLDTKPGQDFLNNLLEEYMPDVIIIDSLQRAISKEMTDELAIKNLISYLSIIRDKYKSAILIVHHNRKKANDNQKKNVELSDVYGSYLIGAEADFIVSLKTVNSSLLGVDLLKTRLGPMIDPFEIYRDDNLTFHLDFENLMDRFGKEGHDGPAV